MINTIWEVYDSFPYIHQVFAQITPFRWYIFWSKCLITQLIAPIRFSCFTVFLKISFSNIPCMLLHLTYMFTIICFPPLSPLQCKFRESRAFVYSYSLFYLQSLMMLSRHSIPYVWVRWMISSYWLDYVISIKHISFFLSVSSANPMSMSLFFKKHQKVRYGIGEIHGNPYRSAA